MGAERHSVIFSWLMLATCSLGVALGMLAQPRLASLFRSAEFLRGLGRVHATANALQVKNVPLSTNSEAVSGQAGSEFISLTEKDVTFLSEAGVVPARLYLPVGGRGPGVVVAHGIHHAGIDEPRLVPFARQLAAAGFTVLTPELTALTHFRIDESGLDALESATRFLLTQSEYLSSDKVGLLGFSFAGGLSLRVATLPLVRDHLSFVFSVGGYHDLQRVLLGYAANQAPNLTAGERRRPHQYGPVVLAYNNLEHLVPATDLDVMGAALSAWLRGEKSLAYSWASQRVSADSERLFGNIVGHDLSALGDVFEGLIERQKSDLDRLSPRGHLRQIRAPVYLLHGQEDRVIFPNETQWASDELGDHPHSALVTPLLGHADLHGEQELGERLQLLLFMSEML